VKKEDFLCLSFVGMRKHRIKIHLRRRCE